MLLRTSLLFSIACSLLFSLSMAQAADSLKNFSPGEYELRSGKEAECGFGEFKIYNDEGPKISLGGLFIFDLQNSPKERIEDNLDEKKECYYEVEDSVDTVADSTVLNFKSTYRCKEETINILTRKAKIIKGHISLNVVQEGKPEQKFDCSWTLAKRKVNSVKPAAGKAAPPSK